MNLVLILDKKVYFDSTFILFGGKMSISEQSVQEVAQQLKETSVFIDVREPGEYTEVHAKGVKNIPLGMINGESVGTENKDKTVFLICRSGKRSMTAAQKLEEEGFEDLVNDAGGTLAWVEAGLDTE